MHFRPTTVTATTVPATTATTPATTPPATTTPLPTTVVCQQRYETSVCEDIKDAFGCGADTLAVCCDFCPNPTAATTTMQPGKISTITHC